MILGHLINNIDFFAQIGKTKNESLLDDASEILIDLSEKEKRTMEFLERTTNQWIN